MFSTVGDLSDAMRNAKDGKFHFYMCYSNIYFEKCLEFKQTSNPLEVTSDDMPVLGLEIIEKVRTQVVCCTFPDGNLFYCVGKLFGCCLDWENSLTNY